ncbi:ABC transporter substrate-binding protein [Natronomonas sp. CBA1123]|uniref:PGF-CTERM-anchored ABC transporter substrate-binding protein n=1 Tax=Natronomonas sp. CBA1123 TaxID=2668070 RepID=UPI0012EAA58F|nr:PGF-CTERM-anchored ABC transporter substrate-binding protein [Natronomonas sp. CBA1123]MUV87649.1 ABC transporter substrate-binding protein [Natronomonas sp. CBA1123]
MTRRYTAVLVTALLVVALSAAAAPAAGATAQSDADCSFPFTATDATGTNVTVEERPDSIVALQPSAAQTLWELDAQDRVAGAPVGPYTDYLEGIDGKTNVLNDDGFSVNQEAVVELDADIVLAPNIVPDETVQSLREANQTVYKFGFGNSLQFVADKTTLTGQLVGSCDAAETTNEEYWNRIDSVRNGTGAYESPRVLHFTDNFTAGSGTFISELITTAGGVNVAAENGVEGYGQINDEALVEWNPEVIIVADDEGRVPNTAAYESTFAVQNDQVVAINGNYLSQPAPRIAIALESIAEALAEAELESDATPTATAADSEPSTTETDSTDGDGAGFGALVALVALLGAALLARRP